MKLIYIPTHLYKTEKNKYYSCRIVSWPSCYESESVFACYIIEKEKE